MRKIWTKKLKQVMEERGLKAKTLSLAAGLNETYIRDLLQKGVEPTVLKLGAIADALGLPLSYLLSEDAAAWPTIPVVGYVAAGEEWQPVQAAEEMAVVDFADLNMNGLDPIAIRVRGHSMSPVFRDGDDLICKRNRGIDLPFVIGKDCVVKTMEGQYYIKLVLKGTTRNTYRLRSYNPIFPDIENVALDWAAPVVFIKRKS